MVMVHIPAISVVISMRDLCKGQNGTRVMRRGRASSIELRDLGMVENRHFITEKLCGE